MKAFSLLLVIAIFFTGIPNNSSAQPNILGCPSDITSCSSIVTWTPPHLDVNYPYTYNSNYSPGSSFPFGTTRVVYTFEDNNGVTATCSFNVTVQVSEGDIAMALSNNVFTGGASNQIFLGYGPQSMLLFAHPEAIDYNWSPTTGLNCTTCPNPVFTPTQSGNYRFTATCTFSSGCVVSYQVEVCVVDPRAGDERVYVCHYPEGVKGKFQIHVVQNKNVQSHLAHGDKLGVGGPPPCSAAKGVFENAEDIIDEELRVDVGPNPFTNSLTINVASNTYDFVDLRVYDYSGRILENRISIPTNQELKIGNDFSTGLYIVEIRNEGISQKIKVVKMQ